jgi:hypothetical protein
MAPLAPQGIMRRGFPGIMPMIPCPSLAPAIDLHVFGIWLSHTGIVQWLAGDSSHESNRRITSDSGDICLMATARPPCFRWHRQPLGGVVFER